MNQGFSICFFTDMIELGLGSDLPIMFINIRIKIRRNDRPSKDL